MPIIDDAVVENNETILIQATASAGNFKGNFMGGSGGPSTGIAEMIIIDNDGK